MQRIPTHINQVMLGWVLEDGEDTRTLLRLTALKRLPGLDVSVDPVQHTINAMAARGVAMDATLAIHENLMLSRNGSVAPGLACGEQLLSWIECVRFSSFGVDSWVSSDNLRSSSH